MKSIAARKMLSNQASARLDPGEPVTLWLIVRDCEIPVWHVCGHPLRIGRIIAGTLGSPMGSRQSN